MRSGRAVFRSSEGERKKGGGFLRVATTSREDGRAASVIGL
jgi:hypothetical protein